MKKNLPDFKGKVVYVQLLGEKRYNLVVDSPHWEDHAGKLFLVGKTPPGGSAEDWCEGILSGIAWDKITDYMVFVSVKDYHRHVGVFSRKRKRPTQSSTAQRP